MLFFVKKAIFMLQDHLKVKEEDRNQAWEEKFFKLFSESHLQILSEDPQQGPDGWPYLMCELDNKTTGAAAQDSAQKVMHWLSTRGIGLVLNPRRAPYPDYVFSYGMIWSFRETGFFMRYDQGSDEKQITIDAQTLLKTGAPSTEYLPEYVRQILKQFFLDQGVYSPRVLMVSQNGKDYDLCFSLESLGNPPQSEHEGVLEAIAWFLPPHYSLALISEKNLPSFQNL